MDKRIYDALVADETGTVGQMRMLDRSGLPWGNPGNPATYIKANEFEIGSTGSEAKTMTWRLFPTGTPADVGTFAEANQNIVKTDIIKNIYLHGWSKQADYVRFVYTVDKEKMDALFGNVNNSSLSFLTSYIATGSSNSDAKQTTYSFTPETDIVVAPGEPIEFSGMGATARAYFKAGTGNNYQRAIGNMKKTGSGIRTGSPSNNGEGYTVAPYKDGSCVLHSEAGLTMAAGNKMTFTLFAASTGTPGTIQMKVNGAVYTFTEDSAATEANKVYNLPNSDVRTGIFINRSANPPHVNEFLPTTQVSRATVNIPMPMSAQDSATVQDFKAFTAAIRQKL
jgi:hypothetical protein